MKEFRNTRDITKVRSSLVSLYRAGKENKNVIRPLVDASKAYATVGEMVGVLRLAHGFSYDTYQMLEVPDFLKDIS